MKALKEKRNSFRSLWRMGLVILSVFALVFVACGDSSAGDPIAPNAPNPNIGGSDRDNGDETPEPPFVQMPVDKVPDRLVVARSPQRFSKEGQPPVLTGAIIDVWYTDGSMERFNTISSTMFGTMPAILGEEQINMADATTPKHAVIQIYHVDNPQAKANITLPGVRALDLAAARGTPTGNVWWASGNKAGVTAPTAFAAAVYGSGRNTGVDLGSTAFTGEVFQDVGVPTIAGLTVRAKYIDFDSTLPPVLNGGDSGITINVANGGVSAISAEWETLTLTQEHIYSDYQRAGGQYVPYGIDTSGTTNMIYIMVSRSPNTTAAVNRDVYIRLPMTGTFHYVRRVEVVDVDWQKAVASTRYPYFTQASALAVNAAATGATPAALITARQNAWTWELIGAALKLRVYYQGYEGYIDRDVSYFRKAVELGIAGVVNDPAEAFAIDPTEEGYAELLIGYYYSARSNSTTQPPDRNPIQVGDFTNAARYKIPVAMFVEASGNLRKQTTAGEGEENDLEFIALKRTEPGFGQMSDNQLNAIQRTYEFWGQFQYESEPPIDALIIPGTDFRKPFFNNNPFADRNEIESVEVSFEVPNASTLRRADVYGPTDARVAQYTPFIGEGDSFNVTVYPSTYDRK